MELIVPQKHAGMEGLVKTAPIHTRVSVRRASWETRVRQVSNGVISAGIMKI